MSEREVGASGETAGPLAPLLAEHAGEETVVAGDATVVANRAPDALGDATVVVNDATVVVHHAPDEPSDATVVVNDATTVVERGPASDSTVVASDLTIVAPSAPQPKKRRRDLRGERAQRTISEALPVPEPEYEPLPVQQGRVDTGLDPERVIAPVPGKLPWESLPAGERGLMQGLPVSYVARPHRDAQLQIGVDEVQRQLGPAPQGYVVPVRSGRETLPSLARRDRKRRLFTLVGYAAAAVVSVLGLWGVASIAFGW